MRITKSDMPVKIDVPGAIARQSTQFGDASEYGTIAAEYFTLGAGTDIAPLLEGLADDACHAPHWGYVKSGALVVSYVDGTAESCATDDGSESSKEWSRLRSVACAEDCGAMPKR